MTSSSRPASPHAVIQSRRGAFLTSCRGKHARARRTSRTPVVLLGRIRFILLTVPFRLPKVALDGAQSRGDDSDSSFKSALFPEMTVWGELISLTVYKRRVRVYPSLPPLFLVAVKLRKVQAEKQEPQVDVRLQW